MINMNSERRDVLVMMLRRVEPMIERSLVDGRVTMVTDSLIDVRESLLDRIDNYDRCMEVKYDSINSRS